MIRRRLGLLALLGAAIVGYARVYCGAHYPADVIFSAIVGTAVACLLSIWLGGATAMLRRLADRHHRGPSPPV